MAVPERERIRFGCRVNHRDRVGVPRSLSQLVTTPHPALGLRLLARVAIALLISVVLAVGATWLWYRDEAKSWAWWDTHLRPGIQCVAPAGGGKNSRDVRVDSRSERMANGMVHL